MVSDPFTLYKLIVLYMLNKVSFPLTNSQISDFILEKEYTNFLTLQQVLSELEENSLVTTKSYRNRTQFSITEEGIRTLSFFKNRISDAIKEDVLQYLKENEMNLRNEVSVTGDYFRNGNGEYVATICAKDKDSELINIRITVPAEEIAAAICNNWQKKNQTIYKYLTEQLF